MIADQSSRENATESMVTHDLIAALRTANAKQAQAIWRAAREAGVTEAVAKGYRMGFGAQGDGGKRR